jgi:hypothetical protein
MCSVLLILSAEIFGPRCFVLSSQGYVLRSLAIRWEDITLKGVIGEGGFGKVFRGRWQVRVFACVCVLGGETPAACEPPHSQQQQLRCLWRTAACRKVKQGYNFG